MPPSYTLEDAEARAAATSFPIPDVAMRERLQSGDLVKLIFKQANGEAVERMWVEVTAVTSTGYQGRLDNDPTQIPNLAAGESLLFEPRHVMSIWVEAHHDWPKRTTEVRHPFTRS